MKLSTWAKREGIHYQTAWRWAKEGKVPNLYTSETGGFYVREADITPPKENVVVYCRVSNFSRKAELEFQVKRCCDFAAARGLRVSKIYKEVASGMNEDRREFWKMMESAPTTIIVENKDRLTRFGFNYITRLLKDKTEVIVMNEAVSDREDIMKDMISIMYSFSARIYGMRRAKNRADKLKKELLLENETDS